MRMTLLAATAAAFSIGSAALAADFADPAVIDRAVVEFTGAAIGAPGGPRLPVDRRLRLNPCDTSLALEWYGRGRETVLVRCPVAGGWRLFVPVEGNGAGPVAAAVSDAPAAVARGETVSIAIGGQGFTLSRQGQALEGGAVGDWIRVRPAGAGNRADPIRARIMRPGVVGMDLP